MKIFISYKREDEGFALQIRQKLHLSGFETWMDIFDIPVSSNWPDEIDAALRGSEVIIGIMSPRALESRNVKNEWDWALVNKRPLVLLLCEKCDIPMNYISINHIDFTATFQEPFSKLEMALQQVQQSLSAQAEIPANLSMLDLLNVDKLESIPVDEVWRKSLEPANSGYLQTVLGMGKAGKKIELKLSPQYGGNNILIVGAPGSGKSELIAAITLGLALKYPPQLLRVDLLNMGRSSSLRQLKELPHVKNFVNVDDENSIKDYLHEVMDEYYRRHNIIFSNGFNSVNNFFFKGSHLPADENNIQHLLLMVDDIEEGDVPKHINVFNALSSFARLGRATCIYVVLAMRKFVSMPDVLHNIGHRFAMRVDSVEDSLASVSHENAARITVNQPCRAYYGREEFQVAASHIHYSTQQLLSERIIALLRDAATKTSF